MANNNLQYYPRPPTRIFFYLNETLNAEDRRQRKKCVNRPKQDLIAENCTREKQTTHSPVKIQPQIIDQNSVIHRLRSLSGRQTNGRTRYLVEKDVNKWRNRTHQPKDSYNIWLYLQWEPTDAIHGIQVQAHFQNIETQKQGSWNCIYMRHQKSCLC